MGRLLKPTETPLFQTCVVAPIEGIDAYDVMAALDQDLPDFRPDKAGTARQENLHRTPSPRRGTSVLCVEIPSPALPY